MPDHLQSFQLDFLTPDLFQKIVKKAITKGVQIPAAHGNYINFHMGDMILVIRTAYDPEKGLDFITGFDSHAKGCCVWDCVIESEREQEIIDVTAKTLMVERNGEVLPLPQINGDILPSFEKGTMFKAQVTAYPETIAFYGNKDAATVACGEKAGKIVAEEGVKVRICGEAVGFRRAETVYDGGVMTRFLMGLIHTEQGDVEIAFPDKLVPEGAEEMLCPGTFVDAIGELAANPAIFELEKGIPGKENEVQANE
ncbi:MAG: hypothetical protein IJO94_08305 [Firmicutes bacterium]|nr:hypothetical protein [Bacillota bacterium]